LSVTGSWFGSGERVPKKKQQLAKLSRPRLYDALPRERLFALLDEKRRHPAVWIAGPPGAGKTTLVASYLESRNVKNYWYHLDAGDSDPATFFYFLSSLAKQIRRGSKATLPYLTPEYLQDLPGFTRRFFRSFFARMSSGSMLVLDNYQEVAREELNKVLLNAIAELPESLNVLLISRTEPPAELARLMANDAAALIEWQDLRLTSDECAAIARARGFTDVSTVESLHARSDGWAAGITLMLAAMRRGQRTTADLEELRSKEAVFDYFAGEVLDRTAPEDRITLLQTASFPQFTPEMAVALSGNPNASSLLDRLFRRHYFTERRGTTELLYRYHDLFREYLLQRARHELSEESLRACRSAAARILLQRGEIENAVELWMQAEDWAVLAGVVADRAEDLIVQGRWKTVLGWLEFFPSDIRDGSPWLVYWQGMGRSAIDVPRARLLLERAYDGFKEASDHPGQLSACVGIIETYFQERLAPVELDRWIQATESLLERDTDVPIKTRMRSLTAMVFALLYRQPGHPLLPVYADEAMGQFGLIQDVQLKLMMAVTLINYFDEMGAFARSEQIIEATKGLVEGEDVLPIRKYVWCNRAGHHYLAVSQFESSREQFLAALKIAHDHGLAFNYCTGRIGPCMTALTVGDLASSQQLIAEMRTFLDRSHLLHLISFLWLELWDCIERGGYSDAARLWEQFQQLPLVGVPIHTACSHCIIEFIVHQEKYPEALARVQAWRRQLAEMNSPFMNFNLLTMEAYVRLKSGDEVEGLRALSEMMELGSRHDFFNNLCWVARMMSYLCARALEAGIEIEYVQKLIRVRNIVPPDLATMHWPRPLKILTLGRFQILRDESPLEFPRKAPKKQFALLKAIISSGPNGIAANAVCDLLWPDLDGDAASEALATILHRLRKLLGRPDAIRLSDGRLTVDERVCSVDASFFDRLWQSFHDQWAAGRFAEGLKTAEQLSEIYRGGFLPQDSDEPWTVSLRARLRARFIRLISEIGAHFESRGEFDRAVECYRRGIETDNLAEEFYQGLMRCYGRQGRKAEGAAVYRQLRQILSVVLGVGPSQATQTLGREILGGS
jgi:LuxR family maltose regulon positive regulatory protein